MKLCAKTIQCLTLSSFNNTGKYLWYLQQAEQNVGNNLTCA